MSVSPNKTLDAKNMACPMPILKAKKAISEIQVNQVLEIIATDPGSLKDFPAWCNSTGHQLLSSESRKDKTYRFLVKRTK
ncbi:MAG TPA: sulfurtransferase TusA family protein [Candidatus Hodarchaeales archaeon]|nr:sulfurtransferase TusA family protein [Candidatus Hodarchaeales archaeon]